MEKEINKLRGWLIRNDSDHDAYEVKTKQYNKLCTALSFERKPKVHGKYNHSKKIIAKIYSTPIFTNK